MMEQFGLKTESKVDHLTNSNTTKSSERDEHAKSQITRPGVTKTNNNKKRKTRKKRNTLQCLLLGSLSSRELSSHSSPPLL